MPRHYVFAAVHETSHLRMLLQLCLNLLDLHPNLTATFLVADSTVPKFTNEFDLQPKSLITRVQSRFRQESVETATEATTDTEQLLAFAKVLPPVVAKLLKGGGTVPSGFLVDCFLCKLVHAVVGKISPELGLPKIPVWHVNASPAVGNHRMFNNHENGGPGEGLRERARGYVESGMSQTEAEAKAFRWIEGRLLEYPDLPPMYDYEFSPQAGANVVPDGITHLTDAILGATRNVDGFICWTVPELEADTIVYMEKVMGMPIIGVGPQFNEAVWDKSEQQRVGVAGIDDSRILTFLDDALARYGSNSAAYISIGSLFWPTKRPELIEHIIHSLLEIQPVIPFVFTKPVRSSKISDDLIRAVEESGRGIITEWAPQVRVLHHEATGMFLTHCGIGSIMEAIAAGVPIIALPFGADQPELAAYYTVTRDCGVQLYQLSSGNDGRTLGNGVVVNSTSEAMTKELNETWSRIRGEDGERYRRNISEIRGLIRKSAESGKARENMLRLGKEMT